MLKKSGEQMNTWTKIERDGYTAWNGETDRMRICVIPSLGSKVISLQDKRTNREWLWKSGKPLGNLGYGSPFGAGDESGWDEMFPGINECRYPNVPWEGAMIPDHGEVWSLPWSDEVAGNALRCKVQGVRFPYTLEKEYSFSEQETLRIDYKLTNRSDAPFPFLWAAHPLFQIHEGMCLHVPEELQEIVISYSAGQRLGEFQDRRSWPIIDTESGRVDLSTVEPANGQFAEKYYFSGKLTEGVTALSDPATGEAITIRFPADKVPYLAIWTNYGGYGGYYHFAIEPATGMLDDLSYAIHSQEVMTVGANEEYEWYIEFSLSSV